MSMKTYKLSCSLGHEPMSWTTQADSKEMAYDNFMDMQAMKDHVAQMHADMASMDPAAMKAQVMGMISEEGGDMASAPAM